MKRLAFAICILSLAVSAAAQDPAPLTTTADARKLADKAVALFQQEKFAQGYAALKPYWPLAEVEIDSLANQTTTQWPVVKQRFGASIGHEFISEKSVGKSFIQYIYIQKFERHAVRWLFTFYKPKDQWIVNACSFDDTISAFF